MTTPTPHRPAAAPVLSSTDTAPREFSAQQLAELFEMSVGDIQSTVIEAASADAGAPTMAPPGAQSAGLTIAAAISGQTITALWAEQSNRNAWAHLQTAGWKRLDPLTDGGSTALTLLAAHSRAVGSAPYVDENPAGTISVMYVW